MIIETINSSYRLYQDGKEIIMEKFHDKKEGNLNVLVGTRFKVLPFTTITVGKSIAVDGLTTSRVTLITPEDGDENIRFLGMIFCN